MQVANHSKAFTLKSHLDEMHFFYNFVINETDISIQNLACDWDIDTYRKIVNVQQLINRSRKEKNKRNILKTTWKCKTP